MMKFLIFILLFPLIGLAEVPATNQELDELNERQEQLFWNEGSAVAVAAAASGTSYKINGGKEKLISRHQSSLRRTSELIQIKRDNHLSTKAVEAHRSNLESSIAKKVSFKKGVYELAEKVTKAALIADLIILGTNIVEHANVRNRMHEIIKCNPRLLEKDVQVEVQQDVADLVKPITVMYPKK